MVIVRRDFPGSFSYALLPLHLRSYPRPVVFSFSHRITIVTRVQVFRRRAVYSLRLLDFNSFSLPPQREGVEMKNFVMKRRTTLRTTFELSYEMKCCFFTDRLWSMFLLHSPLHSFTKKMHFVSSPFTDYCVVIFLFYRLEVLHFAFFSFQSSWWHFSLVK